MFCLYRYGPVFCFPEFYGIRRFLNAFTRALHWPGQSKLNLNLETSINLNQGLGSRQLVQSELNKTQVGEVVTRCLSLTHFIS